MSYLQCTRERIFQDLGSPLGDVEMTAELQAQVTAEASALAAQAFEDGESQALAYAERILYIIHSRSSFAPPLQAFTGSIWGTLMRAKLRTSLPNYAGCDAVNAAEMKRILEAAVDAADQRDHAVLEDIAGEGDLRGLVVYTKNWYGSTHGFTTQLISLAQRCNGKPQFAAAFMEVLENLQDEFGEGSHPEMRSRWPKRIGLDYSPENSMTDADQLTESFALQNFRTGLSCLTDPSYALGSFYSIEAIFPGVCRRLYSTLRGRGFDEEDVITFKLHAEVDVDHAAEFMNSLQGCSLSPQERLRIVNGGLAQLEVRSRMFSAIKDLLYGR